MATIVIFVWSIAAFVLALLVGIFLILAYRRIWRLEVEVKRMLAELSKLKER